MKLHTLTPHESRMHPIDFKVKGQGHGAWLILNCYWFITDSVIKLQSWNFIHLLPMSQRCTLLTLRSKVKAWGSDDWKWFPDHNWYCNPPMIIKLHMLAPMSQGCAILISGSKVKFMGNSDWKWFLDHNWHCNPPMIMKLHTPATCESRMCLIDFGVKSLGLLGIENSRGCSMLIQRVFATRLFASLMHPLLV